MLDSHTERDCREVAGAEGQGRRNRRMDGNGYEGQEAAD